MWYLIITHLFFFCIDRTGSKHNSHHCRRWRAAGDLLGAQTGSDSLHYSNTKGNEEASLRQESRERILNTISWDIWAPAVLIKGFSLLTLLLGGFCKQCNRSRMEKLEKDTRVSPVYTSCFFVFLFSLQLPAAADTFELLIKHRMMRDKNTNNLPWCMCVCASKAGFRSSCVRVRTSPSVCVH